MQNLKVKNRILSLYEHGFQAYNGVSKDEYRQLYFALRSEIGRIDKNLNVAVGEFLLHGAMAFDRFVGPRPQFVNEEDYEMFVNFINSLQKLDGDYTGRTYFLHLDRVRWDLLRRCNLVPYNADVELTLKDCEEIIDKLVLPVGEERIVNNLNVKRCEVLELISAMREGRVRTSIHTSLPFALTNTEAEFKLVVDGVSTVVKVRNQSQGSCLPLTSISEGSTMTTTGPSKWTTTSCELDIEADCLMDGLELKDNVTLLKKEDARFWTSAFDFTYSVVSRVWMYMQQHEDVKGTWPPLPNDLHYLHYRVHAGEKEIDFEMTTNPALVYHVSSLKKPSQQYEIEDEPYRWSTYAYMFAKVYAESGQLKESIFWLNVSVESLVEEFVLKVATTDELRQEIEGEEHKFDSAEEILVQQFPDMAGKVKWPDTVIHTSVFTKLKRAVAHSHLSSLKKDIIKNFQKVNAKRNALFHGDSVDITIEDVEKAFNAYGWLKDKIGA